MRESLLSMGACGCVSKGLPHKTSLGGTSERLVLRFQASLGLQSNEACTLPKSPGTEQKLRTNVLNILQGQEKVFKCNVSLFLI